MNLKMTLVLISLPSVMRTVGWVSLVFLRLAFLGLLSPHQGTTTILCPLLVQLQERQLPATTNVSKASPKHADSGSTGQDK